ncbi:Hypothetical protein DPCES_0666 [Desulfitobacterium hafniense]|uniref:Uncharacterized protein n=1 Tax=Desulfitobacterium hafniense TaxID=49338 RepID=A0A098AVF4_DESHA|nr:hypothetical protein [Desulfitobacterium hafniense]CDX00553.1 Hypothetical protein DPCES_0666 [Desulfitobacterium hafniense]
MFHISDLQIEIQMGNQSCQDNYYWKQLIAMFAVVGIKFEIHCWKEETEEIKAGLKFGKEKTTDWEFGTVIEGVIDDRFIDMLHHTTKPADTEIYNKMTPYFSIFFANGFSSEHYGTEIHIVSKLVDDTRLTMLLEQLKSHSIVVHEF